MRHFIIELDEIDSGFDIDEFIERLENRGDVALEQMLKELPPLYAQAKSKDATAYIKFFTPNSNWTWYITEFDGEDICFGLTQGFEEELGYFSLSELREHSGPLGLQIERDLYFKPTPLSQVRKG